jgi:hypothetical protein
MTRNHGAATQRRILAVAETARSAIRVLTRAVLRYLEPGYLVAMVRYWSGLGVGSYAAFEAARDRAAVTASRPAAQVPARRDPGQRDPGQRPAERKALPAGRRPKMHFGCHGSPSSSVLVPRT